jgi:polyphosphate kinase
MAFTKDTSRFINRELSWIEFNRRVLALAQEPSMPLLERLKFLAITASNLDEFFMTRVGELRLFIEQGLNKKDSCGMNCREQAAAVSREAHAFTGEQARCYAALAPLLAREKIRARSTSELSQRQAEHAARIFDTEIFPVLSPLAVPSTGAFPLLAGATMHLIVRTVSPKARGVPRCAVIPIPRSLSRIIALPADGGYDYMLLEELVAGRLDAFFPGETILECVPFRVTRNAAMRAEDELAADLVVEMTEMLTMRKRSDCLRLEIRDDASAGLVTFLQKGLRLQKEAIYFIPYLLDYTVFMRLTQLPGFSSIKDDPWPPFPLLSLKPGASIFETIARHDIVLHHPYDSFDPVVRFVEEAADDPGVIAIKQTLYRAGKKSRIVAALARAATNGKYVTAIVELKARFDEERNIVWARELEDAGVQVIYGIKGFKTHAKVCLVIRKEAAGVRRYAHFGTGNYNELTAQLYTDVSFFTVHDDLTADASSFFNTITGHSQPQQFRKIAAAPIDLRESIIARIDAEAEHARQGQPAFIKAKMNSLVDPKIIEALYKASLAGVRIELNIRGICCLRPGVKGLSENISVVSIVDRFLEHARVAWFHNGGDDRVFISSADWMPRNLDKRCELWTPVEAPLSQKRLQDAVDLCLHDNVRSWTLKPDGAYIRTPRPAGAKKIRAQEMLYNQTKETAARIRRARRTEFETHGKRKE